MKNSNDTTSALELTKKKEAQFEGMIDYLFEEFGIDQRMKEFLMAAYTEGEMAGFALGQEIAKEQTEKAVAEAIADRDAQWVAREKRTADILFGDIK